MRETPVTLSLCLLPPLEQAPSTDLRLQVSYSASWWRTVYFPLPVAGIDLHLCLVLRQGGEDLLSPGVFFSTMDNGPYRALCFCGGRAPVLWACTNRGGFLLTLSPQTNVFMHRIEVHGKVSLCYKLLCPLCLAFKKCGKSQQHLSI